MSRQWLRERYPILPEKTGGKLCGVTADRGFASRKNREHLQNVEHFNGLCPRDPAELPRRRTTVELFVTTQRRRSQTEGRIGILKNVFLGGRPRAKGFALLCEIGEEWLTGKIYLNMNPADLPQN